MSQHVTEATHNASGCIDLIFTRSECRVIRVTVLEVGLFDHCLVTCVPVRRPEITATPIEDRRWKQFSIGVFKADLANTVLCRDLSWTSSASIDELFDRYSAELSALLDIHAPRYIKKRKARSDSVVRNRVQRHETYYEAIGEKIPSNSFAEWQAELNRPAQATVIIFSSEGEVLLVAMHREQLGVPKKHWEDLDLLMRKSDDAAASSADDALDAEDFSKFFTDKISLIRKEADGASDTEYANNPGASFSMFQPITATQLEDLIAAASNKHCLLDPAPTSLIKNCASLLSYLPVLFNR